MCRSNPEEPWHEQQQDLDHGLKHAVYHQIALAIGVLLIREELVARVCALALLKTRPAMTIPYIRAYSTCTFKCIPIQNRMDTHTEYVDEPT